ncbi:MAG: phospholipase D-like domain-containing protein [Steroidobacteraceae bacterium]
MWTIAVTVLATLFVVIIAMNLHTPEKKVQHKVAHLYGVEDPQLKREMGALLGPAIAAGNRITALQNGDEIFPAMLLAIRGAQRTITFETYIYWSGSIGRQFAEALIERARAGITIHVMLDWLGSGKMQPELVTEMRDAGIEVERYHPLRWYSLGRMNNRTHRKVLIVDGTIGFTGGVGIADQWTGHAQDPEHWRDMHFGVQGPVVAQMQAAFLDNWIKTTGSVLHGEAYFPALPASGEQQMHLFMSSPAGGSSSMRLMYLTAITAAEHSIDIEAAYFVPDSLMSAELIRSRARGVQIRILVPDKHIDSETIRVASKRAWGPLLDAGVQIHEYEPTMLHCKMLIFDRCLVSVGSTNFDMRSFELNDEASLNVYDAPFAQQMTGIFEQDLRLSTPYTLQRWQNRPRMQKFAEVVLIPIKSQL